MSRKAKRRLYAMTGCLILALVPLQLVLNPGNMPKDFAVFEVACEFISGIFLLYSAHKLRGNDSDS